MSRIWKLVSATVLLASLAGCHADRASSDEGRIDLVIRPDSAISSSRPAQGRFTIRNTEGRALERFSIESTYENVSFPLRTGAYVLEWQPELPLDLADDALAAHAALVARESWTQPLLVASGQVTTVNVQASLNADAKPELVASA